MKDSYTKKTNKMTNKIYIGSTKTSIEQRFQDNVDWDPFIKYPKPRSSFLRWHR